jgi:RimJ/RimL family protein N-acetyltransferase/precorrin-3B methylase
LTIRDSLFAADAAQSARLQGKSFVWPRIGALVDKPGDKPGSLVCVGIGMTLGSHITPLSRSHIEQADVVFTALSDGVVELWLAKMNRDVRSLQGYYQEGQSRMTTYRQMVEAILTEVRSGKAVAVAFYGHPGVFAWPGHRAIEIARSEGYAAHMEPGVSAEDCLYADLGIDPGKFGCQHYEASQIMLFRRRIDPSAYLILWQIGIAGDRSLARFSTGQAYRALLVEILTRDYSPDHEVTIYEAATLPTNQPKIMRLALQKLADADINMHATLIVPPAIPLEPDQTIRERLDALDRATQGDGMNKPTSNLAHATHAQPGTESERLTFRSLTSADESLYIGLYTDPEVMKHVYKPLTREHALRSFRNALASMAREPFERRVVVITEKATGQPIGLSGVHLCDPKHKRAEVGTLLKASSHAQRFGLELSTALISQSFGRPQIDELIAHSTHGNGAIEHLLAALGFVRSGEVPPSDDQPARTRWTLRRDTWAKRSHKK